MDLEEPAVLSEYEQIQANTISRNNAKLRSLGFKVQDDTSSSSSSNKKIVTVTAGPNEDKLVCPSCGNKVWNGVGFWNKMKALQAHQTFCDRVHSSNNRVLTRNSDRSRGSNCITGQQEEEADLTFDSMNDDNCCTSNDQAGIVENNVIYEDEGEGDQSDDVVIDEAVVTIPPPPELRIYDFQQHMLSLFNVDKPFRVRRHRQIKDGNLEEIEGFGVEDYIDLARLGDIIGVTEEQGNLILEVFGNIYKRHYINHIKPPKCWRAILYSINNKIKTETIDIVYFPLDKDIWGENNMKGEPLKPSFGITYSILEIIAIRFLYCDWRNCILEPLNEVNEKYEKVNNSLFTGIIAGWCLL